jgi:hypothetical protein
VLDHVQRRRILEPPAGKDLAPGQRLIGLFALFDENLNEGAFLFRPLPGQRALARGELDHDIADAA